MRIRSGPSEWCRCCSAEAPSLIAVVRHSKSATDRAYDQSLEVILSQLASDVEATRPPLIGVLFGTHNAHSCELVLDGLERRRLATRRADGKLEPVDAVRGRVCIGQLYGALCRRGWS